MANLILNKKGNTINLTDSTDNKVKAFALYGKATQNGTPTPDFPVEINVSGSDGSVEVVNCGKNLLKNKLPSFNTQGIKFTVNEDGGVTATGTQTGHAYYGFGYVGTSGLLPYIDVTKKYILSGNTTTNSDEWGYCLFLQINLENGNIRYVFNNNPVDTVVNFNEYNSISPIASIIPYIRIGADAPKPVNVTFYPMLSLEGGEYEPYKETLSTIQTPNGLPGIPVSSGGNYTDENGQQWVCDSIVKYADGTGKYVQRIGKAVFDGSESWTLDAETNFNENTFTAYCSNLPPIAFYGRWVPIPSLCNRLVKSETQVWDNKITNECFMVCKYSEESANEAGQITIRLNKDRVSTISSSAVKAFFASNPMTVYYELAEPIITDISVEEIAEIEKLQTFYPVTNISNDAGCGMEISYVSTKQNMQVKALLSGVETTFTDLGNNVFEAVLTAPNHDGLYEIEINAVSQTGDTTSATVDLTVASWITSKIDWKPTDRLNIQDFNRIRNNMIALWELLQWEFGHFTIEDMGDELTEYTGRWNVNHFNAFEKNLEIFRTLLPIDDFGLTQTFYYNSMLIKYDELNRIENLLLRFKQYATSREAGIRKLPFRLGAFREVRI